MCRGLSHQTPTPENEEFLNQRAGAEFDQRGVSQDGQTDAVTREDPSKERDSSESYRDEHKTGVQTPHRAEPSNTAT